MRVKNVVGDTVQAHSPGSHDAMRAASHRGRLHGREKHDRIDHRHEEDAP